MTASTNGVIPLEALRAHWQGHRRLTRRVIEAFPEEQLTSFSLGGMRPFGEIVLELLSMAEPMARGIASGEWATSFARDPLPKGELLARWDESTAAIDAHWQRTTAERLGVTMTAFGQYEGIAYDLLLYVIDNEIHHRGQGYVYLRALGIEPPPFWERG
ncbi:MAG TPA: DinB family protein [Longimicrobiales bacterium]|nr:DinB family protein [Longimicrobiales bacterium]